MSIIGDILEVGFGLLAEIAGVARNDVKRNISTANRECSRAESEGDYETAEKYKRYANRAKEKMDDLDEKWDKFDKSSQKFRNLW